MTRQHTTSDALHRLNTSTLAVGKPKSEGTKRNKAEKYWLNRLTHRACDEDPVAAELWERFQDQTDSLDSLKLIRRWRDDGPENPSDAEEMDALVMKKDGDIHADWQRPKIVGVPPRAAYYIAAAERIAADRNYIDGH